MLVLCANTWYLNESVLIRNEVFGPVAPLLRFKTEEEAISIANDTDAGLFPATRTAFYNTRTRTIQLIIVYNKESSLTV